MKIDETKDIIVSVANKLFSRFGFQKTSMDDIAKTARKAKGSIYYHFTSKEELFKEVVSREMSVLKNQLSVIVHNTELNAGDKIKNYLILRMELLNNASNYHETLKADFYEHYIFIDDLRSELDKWEIVNLRNILELGIKEGDFTDSGNIEVLLEMIIMVLKGLEIPFFLQNKYNRYSPHFNDLIGVLIKGLSK